MGIQNKCFYTDRLKLGGLSQILAQNWTPRTKFVPKRLSFDVQFAWLITWTINNLGVGWSVGFMAGQKCWSSVWAVQLSDFQHGCCQKICYELQRAWFNFTAGIFYMLWIKMWSRMRLSGDIKLNFSAENNIVCIASQVLLKRCSVVNKRLVNKRLIKITQCFSCFRRPPFNILWQKT